MKNLLLKGLLAILATILMPHLINAQHFTTVWSGSPYQPMAFVVQGASIDGVNLESGDEIAVFDEDASGNEICVGTVVLTGPITPSTPSSFSASHEENGGDGFITGNTIIYKLWDNSESLEITMVVPTYTTFPGFDEVYSPLGTAIVTSLVGSSSVETTASSITTCQGSVIDSVDVNNIIDVTEFSLILDYGTTNLSYTGYQNVNTQLNSGNISVTENNGEITIAWNSNTAANITSGTLVEILFTALTVYNQATENLTWNLGDSYYINSNGDTLQDVYNNGVITINPIPVDAGSITGATSVCQGTTGESYQVGAITNATSYVWDLVPSTAGTINGNGTTITVDFSSTYSGQATLSVYGSNSCGDGTASPLLINIIGNATVDAGSDATICEDNNYSLSGTATNQQSVLWITSGDGTFDDATILSATYTPGSNDISAGTATLSLTAYATTPCATDTTDNMVLTIQDLPTSGAGADATICEDATHTLSGTATNQQSILWSTSGDGSFDDASILSATYTPGTNDISAGTATLSLTAFAITPCAADATDNMVLTIQGLPTSGAGSDVTICEDATLTLSGTATNQQSVLWTTSGDGTFDDATILSATYTPGTNDISTGTATLSLTAYATTPCGIDATDNMVLTIQDLPTSGAGSDATICEDATHTLSGAATNQQSVLWTTSGDGTFDDATILSATYTPGTSDISTGTATLSLTAYATTPCATNANDNMVLTIQGLPTADAGGDGIICENNYYTLSGSATNQQSVLWSTNGDGSFDDVTLLNATYTMGANDLTNGSVDLTLTAYAVTPCGIDANDEMTISTTGFPTVDAGDDDITCQDAGYTLSGSATNQQTILWTTSGDGTFDDATILSATYTAGANDIINGTVDLTLTVYGCGTDEASDDMTLTIQVLPTANAGDDDDVCENDSYTLNGSATSYDYVYWSTIGDGVFDDAFILNATYTPGTNDIAAGSVNLTMDAYAISPCNGEVYDDMTLNIQLAPSANAGDDGETCEDETYLLDGSAVDYESVDWTTSGDGTFDDSSILDATYTPGTNDISAGTATLSLTAYAITPCGTDTTDNMILSIASQSPDQPLLPEGPVTIDLDATTTSEYITGEVTNASSYQWHLNPLEAGTIEGDYIVGTVYWNPAYTGIDAYIHVIAQNGCGQASSDTLGVSVSPVGIDNTSAYSLEIFPNPSNGIFNVSFEDFSDEVNLEILNHMGNQVYTKMVNVSNSGNMLTIDISFRASGTYYLKLISGSKIYTKKIIIIN
jgi:hypothetical protein